MEDNQRIEFLKNKLYNKKSRVDLKYKYYDQKYIPKDFSCRTPKHFINYHVTLGWCTKAVDSLANRLVFKEFKNDTFEINEVFNMNNSDVLFDSAIRSALISSCSFVYISPDEDGYPRLQVIDGSNATGIIDTQTSMLKEGYAILETDNYGKPTLEAYFTKNYTSYYENGKEIKRLANPTLYPLLVPIIYKPSDTRPFGRSRITRACIDICNRASIVNKMAIMSSEYYSTPQKVILGLSEDVDFDSSKADLSSFLAIYKDEDGGIPTVTQFNQQSMSPFVEQIASLVKEFCGETSLTSDDLGFVTSNPSSAEAIKASHENLRLLSREAQRNFGICFLNVGYLSVSLRDKLPYKRKEFYRCKAQWEPIFEPDVSTLSGIGDGAIKLNQAVDGFISKETLSDLTGIQAEY